MGLVDRLKRMVGRGTDPYEYECTVCDRTFQSERTTCPDCGGTVERKMGPSSPADPQP